MWQRFFLESACSAGDSGLIPRSGRSTGKDNGNPLQYCCLENPMDREAWQATVMTSLFIHFALHQKKKNQDILIAVKLKFTFIYTAKRLFINN